jgi:hypothetical protein
MNKALFEFAVKESAFPPATLSGTNTTIHKVPSLPDNPLLPFCEMVIVGKPLLVGIMALLFPQSVGSAPVPQRCMFVEAVAKGTASKKLASARKAKPDRSGRFKLSLSPVNRYCQHRSNCLAIHSHAM